MYYVYILRSHDFKNKIYTGFTQNLNQRIKDHNNGKSKHTSKYKSWKIAYYSVFVDKQKALDFEKYLKTSSGIAFRNKRLL